MKRIGVIAFFILILNLFTSIQASALSCVEIPTIPEAYQKYDGVVIGRVVSVQEKRQNNQVKLSVMRSFKGIKEEKLDIFEDKFWGALSGPSVLHEEYLFFLNYEEGQGWVNPLCTPTKKVADISGDEFTFLDARELQLTVDGTEGAMPIHASRSYIVWGSAIVAVILGIAGWYLWLRRRRG